MSVTHNVVLNVDKDKVRLDQRVHVRCGDVSSQVVRCALQSGGAAWTPATGSTAKLEILKPDGTWTVTNASISGSNVSGTVPAAAMSAPGECKRAYFRIINGSTEDTTEDFYLYVYPNATQDAIESLPFSDEFEALLEASESELRDMIDDIFIKREPMDDSSATYDLNSYVKNGAHVFATGPTYVNAPDEMTQGILVVFQPDVGAGRQPIAQLLYTTGPKIFIRWKWSTWGTWRKLVHDGDGPFTTLPAVTSGDCDVNTLTSHGIALLRGTATYSNVPDGFKSGVIISFTATSNAIFQLLYVNVDTVGGLIQGRTYMRFRGTDSSWSNWTKLALDTDTADSFVILPPVSSGTCNLNDLVKSGALMLMSYASYENAPEGFTGGHITVSAGKSSNVVLQILDDGNNALWWRRRNNSNVWSPWALMSHSNGSLTTAAAITSGEFDLNTVTGNKTLLLRGTATYLNTPGQISFASGMLIAFEATSYAKIQILYSLRRVFIRYCNVSSQWQAWIELSGESETGNIDMYGLGDSWSLKTCGYKKRQQAMCIHDGYLVSGLDSSTGDSLGYSIGENDLVVLSGQDVGHVNAVTYDSGRDLFWVSGWDDGTVYGVRIDFDLNTYSIERTVDVSQYGVRTTCAYCEETDQFFITAAQVTPVIGDNVKNYNLVVTDIDGVQVRVKEGIEFAFNAVQDIHVSGLTAYVAHGYTANYPSKVTAISVESLTVEDVIYFNGGFESGEIEGITAENGDLYLGWSTVYKAFSL